MLASMDKIFDYFWNTFGNNIPIYIQELGPFNSPSASIIGTFRDAQAQYADTHANVFMGADTTGKPLFDSQHFTVDGYNDIAVELANSVVDGALLIV